MLASGSMAREGGVAWFWWCEHGCFPSLLFPGKAEVSCCRCIYWGLLCSFDMSMEIQTLGLLLLDRKLGGTDVRTRVKRATNQVVVCSIHEKEQGTNEKPNTTGHTTQAHRTRAATQAKRRVCTTHTLLQIYSQMNDRENERKDGKKQRIRKGQRPKQASRRYLTERRQCL